MGRKTETPALPATSTTDYVLLPSFYPPPYRLRLRHRSFCSRLNSFSYYILLPSVLLSAALFFLWPSQPYLKLSRLRLDSISFSTNEFSSILPHLSINIAMDLTVMVRNKDFFSLDYRSIVTSIGYRGRQLGFVTSGGGHIRARGSSYVNATLQIDGAQVIHDVIYLLDDIARGSIPFDTVTKIKGQLGLFFFDVPIQAKESCEVYVNTNDQTVTRQDC